ncbi:MAG: hypothetical protein AMXMBFR84_38910 [Candidatus Hydrogenedentota bacterium]
MREVTDDIAVVGGGPVGAATVAALAAHPKRRGRILWFDSNRPLEGSFDGLSASGPYAAGQILANSFDPDTLASHLARRTLAAMNDMARANIISVSHRPWLVCARNGNEAVDIAARDALDAAWCEGRLRSFKHIYGQDLARFPFLKAGDIAFAVCDESALAVDPRRLVVELAQWAASHESVRPYFGYTVTEFDGTHFIAASASETVRLAARAAILCTGVHRLLFPSALPESETTFLHVFDYRSPAHMPSLDYSVAGEATIARYEIFGAARQRIKPHLQEAVREFDIHPLLTDVPGLRRMLDTHFTNWEQAAANTPECAARIRDQLGRLVHRSVLPGDPAGHMPLTATSIASYARCVQPMGNPTVQMLNAPIMTLYVQPSNGRGITQCIGLGEHVANWLLDHFDV